MHATGYDAIRHGAALVDRQDLVVLRGHGRDPVKMIQGLVTNDVAAAEEGHAVYAGFLTPKGKLVADARVLRRGGEVWLVVSRSALEALSAHLRKFVPPLFARFEVAPYAVLGVYGPRASSIAGTVGAGAGDGDGDGDVPRGGALVVDDAWVRPGVELLVPNEHTGAVRARLIENGAVEASLEALDVARIEDGVPVWGAELTEDVIPLEAGLRQRAISETKGCYTGQEVIIRILHRGHVNRHLRALRLGDAAPPASGTALYRPEDGRQVGTLTSARVSPKFGETIGLGYVRREIEPPSELRLGAADGVPVRVEALPA